MFNGYMVESTVCHVNEKNVNSEECSELDTTSAAMMLFNNGYAVMMDTSCMMDKKCSIYYYFSSTFEVANLFTKSLLLVLDHAVKYYNLSYCYSAQLK